MSDFISLLGALAMVVIHIFIAKWIYDDSINRYQGNKIISVIWVVAYLFIPLFALIAYFIVRPKK